MGLFLKRMCLKLKAGTDLVLTERKKIADWLLNESCSNSAFVAEISRAKLSNYLAPNGKLSLQFHLIRRRLGNPWIMDLTERDIVNVHRHLKWAT